jgi:hypothetical protein
MEEYGNPTSEARDFKFPHTISEQEPGPEYSLVRTSEASDVLRAEDEKRKKGLLSEIRGRIGALALVGTLAASAGNVEAKTPVKHEKVEKSEAPKKATSESYKSFFDKNPEFFREVPGGEFSPTEHAARTKTIRKGITVFRDIGVTFYKVQKGDSIEKIRGKLSLIPEFKYVKDQRNKIQSFNIKDKWLKAGMDLPIPMENSKRELTDEQFYAYARKAVEKMKTDAHYAIFTKQLLEVMSEDELVALVMGAAKTESGGKPMGHNEFHRFEKPRNGIPRFSYGAHHVMIEGPGAAAKRDLNLTLGQLYHPQNSSKLFIGFLANKIKERGGKVKPGDFFPLTPEKAEKFAEFYNGKYWRERNKRYDKNIDHFYHESLETIQSLEIKLDPQEMAEAPVVEEKQPSSHQEYKPVHKPKHKAEKEKYTHIDYVNIHVGKALFRAILDANVKNGRKSIKTNAEAMKLSNKILKYLEKMYGDNTYYSGDKIGVGIDRLGPVMVFERDGKRAIFRIKN